MTILFISDLHLSNERPDKLELFFQFIKGPARHVDTLYILGDFFEYWIGDDDLTPPNPDILKALSSLEDAQTKLYVMAGNRDFLMSHEFENITGATLIPDPYIIDLFGEKTLLMHGDLLCTKDVDYLKFRSMVRTPEWQKTFSEKSFEERLAIAKNMRLESKEALKNKIPVIMDVEQKTVELYMKTHEVNFLIHGHTHRPAIHYFNLAGAEATRTVLGDWYQNENVLVCEANDQRLVSIQELV
ncbi:MAG: UDP-2,3-diacylglucosamine diphosphatase [Gammaproteobacteria bacterium]